MPRRLFLLTFLFYSLLPSCKSSDEESHLDTGLGENPYLSYLYLQYLNGSQYTGSVTIQSCQDAPVFSNCLLQQESETEILNARPDNSAIRITLAQNALAGNLELYISHVDGGPYTFKPAISGTTEYTPDGRVLITLSPVSNILAEGNGAFLLDIRQMDLEMNNDVLTGVLKARLHSTTNSNTAQVDYTLNYRKSL